MKLVEHFVEYLPSTMDVFDDIERVAKTCYKSEVKGGVDAQKFCMNLIENGHTSMLEHATVYLKIPYGIIDRIFDKDVVLKYFCNPYVKVVIADMNEPISLFNGRVKIPRWRTYALITTNVRVLYENGWSSDMEYSCEPTAYHKKRYTLRITTDTGVTHELVRHRKFSFAQESSRYCNYGLADKFGRELTFIKPYWYDDVSDDVRTDFENNLRYCEDTYLEFIDKKLTPQQARQVLPKALKSEICMTGFAEDWKHFLDLRYHGKTGKPHPDMLCVSKQVLKILSPLLEEEERNLWD